MERTGAILREAMQTLPVVNTHAHQKPDLEEVDFTLDKLLQCSYTGWLKLTWDSTPASREAFLSRVRYNSFFHWMEEGLKDLYGFQGHLTAEIWDSLSSKIQADHRRPGYWSELLTGRCRYNYIIQDSFWNPGDDNNCPSIYRPTFRINAFFFSYRPDSTDHNQNNVIRLYNQGQPFEDLDAYVGLMRTVIAAKQQQGCVALKLPIAYDRGLDFTEMGKAEAEAAYRRLQARADPADIRAFQNYILFQLCAIAAELDLPLQVHTGMGKLERSNAIWLEEVIRKNPAVKFVLLHCSYPWIEDTLALLRTYPNVYPDLAWLPQLGTYEARQMISGVIECGAAHKACWGCDTWTPEESYGSLLAFQSVLSSTLAEKVESGYMNLPDAEWIMRQISSENAIQLYGDPIRPDR